MWTFVKYKKKGRENRIKNVPCYVQAKHKHVRSRNVTKMELFLNRIFLLIIIIKCRHRFVGFVFLFLFFSCNIVTATVTQYHYYN